MNSNSGHILALQPGGWWGNLIVALDIFPKTIFLKYDLTRPLQEALTGSEEMEGRCSAVSSGRFSVGCKDPGDSVVRLLQPSHCREEVFLLDKGLHPGHFL